MDEVTTVRAGCDTCGVTMTAAIVGDAIPADVAQFFRVHAAHAVTRQPSISPAAVLPRPRFSRGR